MKSIQHELPQAEQVFNLTGQSAPDPWRVAREKLEEEQRRKDASEYQQRMQRKLEECPGFSACDAPSGPLGRGKVVVEFGLAGEAAVWLKRRFHTAESLELSDSGICFQIAPRIRRVTRGLPRRKVSFEPGVQYTLDLE